LKNGDQTRERSSIGRCLSDEETAAYVDGVVSPDARKRIEGHLIACGFCLHNVAELKELVCAQVGCDITVPAEAMARGQALVAERTQTAQFDITMALRRGLCRLLETTGELLVPGKLAPAVVRGEKRTESSLRVVKSLSGYLVTVDLAAGRGGVQPTLTVTEEASSSRPDGLKAKLYSPDTSETKYSRRGKLSFSHLAPGRYEIDIEEIGEIRLDIQ
jgi:hypothetical protein